MNSLSSAVIVGAGHLARHFAPRLKSVGVNILGIYNRSYSKSEELSQELSVPCIRKFEDIPLQADIYILMVSDGAIKEISKNLSKVIPHDSLVVHCSANSPLEFIEGFERKGVLYPLQTFGGSMNLSWDKTPVICDASHEDDLKALEGLAGQISERCYSLGIHRRRKVHLAAVFTNNFSNHMLHIARGILKKGEVDFDILEALAEQTVINAFEDGPEKAQTGPAIRGDQVTLETHIKMLDDDEELKMLYIELSRRIRQASQSKTHK